MSIDDAPRVEVASAEGLTEWLTDHHDRADGAWVVTFKKHHSDRYVSVGEVVAACLCFGWVDSRSRRVDDDRTSFYISPRKAGSTWSAINRALVSELEADGRMTAAGRACVEIAKADGSWTWLEEIEALIVPPDLQQALDQDAVAAEHYQAFRDAQKRALLSWIKQARTTATRNRRIATIVARAAAGICAR